MKTPDELKQIAADLYEGKIFCDRQCDSAQEVQRVFLPMALGALSELKPSHLRKVGLIYEYVDKAGRRGVNGKPMFFSMKTLSKEETLAMAGYYEEYKKMKEGFLNKEPS